MFWRRKKVTLSSEDESSVLTLASKLGVERRRMVRIRYPRNLNVCKLPEVAFLGQPLKIVDISVGGCCLLDPNGFLGSAIGQDIQLEIHWVTGKETIQARIVSRVDHRRHIQFLNLNTNRQTQLKKFMFSGVRGLSMRQAFGSEVNGPDLAAAEIWNSPHGDSLVIEHDVHRLAQVHLFATDFVLFKGAWPQRVHQPCTKLELEQIILFLVNIPIPSARLKTIVEQLEGLFLEAAA